MTVLLVLGCFGLSRLLQLLPFVYPSSQSLSVFESVVDFLGIQHNNNEAPVLSGLYTASQAGPCSICYARLYANVLLFLQEFMGILP